MVFRRTARTCRVAATYALGQRAEDVPAANMNVWPQELLYDPAGQLLGHYFNYPPQRDWWHVMVPALGRIMVNSEQWYVGNAWIYHYDALGSALEVTDHTGAPLQHTLHYPWGQVWQGGTGIFAGLFYLQCQLLPCFEESQTRDYPPNLGRWMSPDPLAGDISNPQSLNRYAYVLNNPCSLTDPLGLDSCSFNIAVVNNANGLSDSQLSALENELNWVLTQAGVGAQFVQPGSADYTITVTPYSPPSVPSNYLGLTPIVPTGPQSPIAARQVANYGFVYASNVASLPFASSFTPNSFAGALGAVAAHEFGHWALPLPTDSSAFVGIMGAPTNSLALNPIPLQFTALQAQALQGRCQALHGSNSSGGSSGGSGGGTGVPWGWAVTIPVYGYSCPGGDCNLTIIDTATYWFGVWSPHPHQYK